MKYQDWYIVLGVMVLTFLMIPPVKAEVQCYTIPGQTIPVCILDNRGIGYMNQVYIQERPRYDYYPQREKAPQHNYSECSFATGCNPYK